jgi:hypothetical protein
MNDSIEIDLNKTNHTNEVISPYGNITLLIVSFSKHSLYLIK